MLNDMIQVRNKSGVTHRKNTYRIVETLIVSFKLLFGSTENRVIPVTKDLYYQPEKQNKKQNPFSDRSNKIISNKGYAIKTLRNKLCTFYSHPFN